MPRSASLASHTASSLSVLGRPGRCLTSCALPRNGLSTSPCREAARPFPSCRLPRGGDLCAPVAVATDRDRTRIEQRDAPLGGSPAWQPAATQHPPADAWVLAAQPAHHPTPTEGVQVGERLG